MYALLIRVLPSLSKPTVSDCAGTVLRGNSQLEVIKYSTTDDFKKWKTTTAGPAKWSHYKYDTISLIL